jgi:hypothetical protein
MSDTATIRAAAKVRLDIGVAAPDTSFDTLIDQLTADMVKRLWPRAGREVPEQTVSPTIDSYGQARITLSALATPCDGVREVEADDGSGEYPVRNFFEHGGIVRIRGLDSSVTSLHIYGLARFTLATLYEELELVLIYYVVSEFYNYLAGDKRIYNQYMANGRPAVDNMKDLSDQYAAMADVILDEKAVVYGR